MYANCCECRLFLVCTWLEFLENSTTSQEDYPPIPPYFQLTLKCLLLARLKLMCIAFWFITSHIITNDRVERWCCVMYIIFRSQQRVDSNSNDHSFTARLVHIILGGLCCFWSTGSLQLVLVEACRKSSTNCETEPPAHSGWECFVKLEESTRKFIPSQPSFNIQSEKTTKLNFFTEKCKIYKLISGPFLQTQHVSRVLKQLNLPARRNFHLLEKWRVKIPRQEQETLSHSHKRAAARVHTSENHSRSPKSWDANHLHSPPQSCVNDEVSSLTDTVLIIADFEINCKNLNSPRGAHTLLPVWASRCGFVERLWWRLRCVLCVRAQRFEGTCGSAAAVVACRDIKLNTSCVRRLWAARRENSFLIASESLSWEIKWEKKKIDATARFFTAADDLNIVVRLSHPNK